MRHRLPDPKDQEDGTVKAGIPPTTRGVLNPRRRVSPARTLSEIVRRGKWPQAQAGKNKGLRPSGPNPFFGAPLPAEWMEGI